MLGYDSEGLCLLVRKDLLNNEIDDNGTLELV